MYMRNRRKIPSDRVPRTNTLKYFRTLTNNQLLEEHKRILKEYINAEINNWPKIALNYQISKNKVLQVLEERNIKIK